jgi:small subunit ribosomal protein SAe
MSADKLPAALQATEEDIQLLLSAQCHLGTKNCDKTMEPYVFKRRADGKFACGLYLMGCVGLGAVEVAERMRRDGERGDGVRRKQRERGSGRKGCDSDLG